LTKPPRRASRADPDPVSISHPKHNGRKMTSTTLLIIIVVVLLLGGGGLFFRRR
jgi:LPXTG-motif cell wall-anchored protein